MSGTKKEMCHFYSFLFKKKLQFNWKTKGRESVDTFLITGTMALFRNNRIEGLWLTLNQFQLFNETSPGIFFGFFGLSSKSLKVFCWLLLTLAGIWCFSKLPPPWLRPQNMMLQCGCADFVVMSCVVFAPSIPSGVIARKFESPKCLRGRKKKVFYGLMKTRFNIWAIIPKGLFGPSFSKSKHQNYSEGWWSQHRVSGLFFF